jgi:O-antigen ligase
VNRWKEATPKAWLPLGVVLAVPWVAAADSLRRLDLQAPATAATAALLGLSAVLALQGVGDHRRFQPLLRPASGTPLALYGFAVWVAFSLAVVGASASGLQNILVYAIFVFSIVSASQLSSDGTALWLLRGIRVAAVIACLLWLPTVFTTGIGTDGVLVVRAAAGGAAVVGLVASIGLPRDSRLAKLTPWFLLLITALTLSRLTIVIAGLLVFAMVLIGRGKIDARALFSAAGVATAAYLVATQYEPLQRRFEQNDGASLFGIEIGTTGRENLWGALTSRLAAGDPLIGQGAGAAQDTIAEVFVRITQPHNDYLRLLFDFGWIGLALWILAMIQLLAAAVIRLLRSADATDRAIHLSATAAVVTISVYAGFNNIIIGINSMLAFGTIIGASIARCSDKRPIAPLSKSIPTGRATQTTPAPLR